MYELNFGKTIYKQAKKNPFRVCIIGHYLSGKSTLINCLTGRTIFHPSLSLQYIGDFNTQVIYGPNDGMARVSWRDPSRQEMVIPYGLFSKMVNEPHYLLNAQEVENVTLTSETMDPRLCYRKLSLFVANVFNISCGSELLDMSDAIVFVLNAAKLGAVYEVDYIKSHFAGRGLRNVFFVINWYNVLREEDREDFHKELKWLLSPVFTDAIGYFDEALYNQRVFLVDAYTSECARTGVALEKRIGTKFVKVPVAPEEDAYTGVPEFERALYRFLGLKK